MHDALDRITQTLFARMQQKGTMMISFNPLKDHGLPRFFRLIVNNVTVCGVHSCQIAGIKRERQRCAESETGRQADTDRQINTNTDTHRHTQTHTDTLTQTGRHTHTNTDRQTHTHTDTHTLTQTGRHTHTH